LITVECTEFAEFVRRHSRFVFQVTYAVLRNSHDAEDATQETFLKLYRHHGWKQAENERAFLARAAWRIAIDRCRGRKLLAQSREWNADELPSAHPSPEQILLRDSHQAMIHGLIDALPEQLRHPLALSAVQELNSREIGEILNLPEGTVRTRLQRARQMLRQKISAIEEAHHARTR
jgi:RNA polymerase sigma-70 factor (ECF subfamily)